MATADPGNSDLPGPLIAPSGNLTGEARRKCTGTEAPRLTG